MFGPGCSGAPIRVLRFGSSVPGLGCKGEGVGVRVLRFGCFGSGGTVGVFGCLGVGLGLSGSGAAVSCLGWGCSDVFGLRFSDSSVRVGVSGFRYKSLGVGVRVTVCGCSGVQFSCSVSGVQVRLIGS